MGFYYGLYSVGNPCREEEVAAEEEPVNSSEMAESILVLHIEAETVVDLAPAHR